MTEVKEEIKKTVDAAVDEVVHDDPETNKQARRRQPWMPILGAILAALLLFVLIGIFT